MTLVEWPDGLPRPWKHQHEAYDKLGSLWAAGRPGTALISDMGTGKTLAATALFKAFGFRRTLVVSGTKAMVEEWPDKLAEYTGGELEGVPLLGTLKQRAAQVAALKDVPGSKVVVTNVESYWNGELGHALERTQWDCIAFDESQRIKGAGSKSSLFALLLSRQQPDAKRLIMTGTPLHDKPLDAYGQYRFVDASLFGTNYAAFKQRYAYEREVKRGVYKVVGYHNLEELAEKMYAVSFRVDDSVLDLPPQHHVERTVRLSPATSRLYNRLDSDGVLDFGEQGAVIAGNVMTKLLRLQQLTSGYTTLTDALGRETDLALSFERGEALRDLLEEIDASKPVVVFAQFTHDLEMIRFAAEAAGRPYFEQSGARSEWRKWRSDTSPAVIGVQYKAGGAGVDLTRASHAIFYSHGFSYGDYRQAVKRLHRPGQEDESGVTYTHLVAQVPGAKRSVDRLILKALRSKRDVSEYVYSQEGHDDD